MMQPLRPSDRRAFGRRETSLHGMVRVAGRAPEPCIVRDFSDGGAKLEFHEAVRPAEKFRLVIEAKGFESECHVSRRMGHIVGVSFASPTAACDLGANLPPPPVDHDGPAPTPASAPQIVHPSPSRHLVLVVPAHEVRSKLFG